MKSHFIYLLFLISLSTCEITLNAVKAGSCSNSVYTFTITGNNIEDKLAVNFDDVPQEMLYEWTDVEPGTIIAIYNVVGASGDYESELPQDSNSNWVVEMPDEDLTVTINYIVSSGESGASGAS